MSISQKLRHSYSDDDEEWVSGGTAKRKRKKVSIPMETSKWGLQVLDKLHISWDHTMSDSPLAVIKLFCGSTYEDEDVDELAKYIEQTIDFDIDLSFYYKYAPGRQTFMIVRKQLQKTFEDLEHLETKLNAAVIGGTLEPMKLLVHVHGIEFIEVIKEYILRLAFDRAPSEGFAVSMFNKFCRMCNLRKSNVIEKRCTNIEGVKVVSIPDLVFTEKSRSFVYEENTTLCVAKFFVSEYEYDGVNKTKRRTRSSDSKESQSDTGPKSNMDEIGTYEGQRGETKSNLFPNEIDGTSQHVGQLLLESTKSVLSNSNLGLLFSETKVMFTCLKLSLFYLSHMEEELHASDSGIVHFSDMYNILRANDRNKVIKALLGLGHLQREGLSTTWMRYHTD